MSAAARCLGALGLVLLVAGCDEVPFTPDATVYATVPNYPSELGAKTYQAVDDMLADAPLLTPNHSVAVVGSLADIRDVTHGSPFGNIIADLVRTRLTQKGLPVIDIRLRQAIKFDPLQGEMLLSRQRPEVYPPPMASEFVTGTYAVASGTVYVSLKIIQADSAQIIAANDFRLARTPDVNRLLDRSVADRSTPVPFSHAQMRAPVRLTAVLPSTLPDAQ
jgi:hypothetical protein